MVHSMICSSFIILDVKIAVVFIIDILQDQLSRQVSLVCFLLQWSYILFNAMVLIIDCTCSLRFRHLVIIINAQALMFRLDALSDITRQGPIMQACLYVKCGLNQQWPAYSSERMASIHHDSIDDRLWVGLSLYVYMRHFSISVSLLTLGVSVGVHDPITLGTWTKCWSKLQFSHTCTQRFW